MNEPVVQAPGDRTGAAGLSQPQARLAGLFYLGTIVGGLFAEIGVRAQVRSEDAATTLANIRHHEMLYRMGEASDLFMLGCYVAVTALLYRLFAPGARSLALAAAGFSLVGIAVLTVAGLLHLIPLRLLADPALAGRADIAWLALGFHGTLYGISLFFFGTYCMLIGWLCLSSRLVPRFVGALMLIGGLTHVVTRCFWILAPQVLELVPRPLNSLPLVGEATLALWLLFFGLRRGKPVPPTE